MRDPSSAMMEAPSSAEIRAEKGGSMEGTSLVGIHCSSRASEATCEGDLREKGTNLAMASMLQSLSTAMLVMQERQEALINEIRADFASKISANNQATQREMEELRAATEGRQRRVREKMDMA